MLDLFNRIADFFQSNWGSFLDSLPIMGIGMLGIFIVTGVIVLTVEFLNTLGTFAEKRRKKKEEEN